MKNTVDIVINKHNKLDDVSSLMTLHSNHTIGKIFCYLEYAAIYKNNDILVNKDALYYIINDNYIENIVSNLKHATGNFILLIEKNDYITILTSVGSHGVYVSSKNGYLIIKDDLKEVVKETEKYDVNEYRLIEELFISPADGSPYETIFKDCMRIPSAHNVTIYPNFQINPESYLLDIDNAKANLVKDDEEGYQAFKKAFNINADLLSIFPYEYIMLLGGIDSIASLISLMYSGANIQAMSYTESVHGRYNPSFLEEIITNLKLSRDLEFSYKIVDTNRFDKNLTDLRHQCCKINSSNMSRYGSMIYYSILDKINNSHFNNPCCVSGTQMDSLLGIHLTKNVYDRSKPFYKKGNRGFLYNLIQRPVYTSLYQYSLRNNSYLLNNLANFYRKFLGSSQQYSLQYEYLSAKAQTFSFQKNKLPFFGANHNFPTYIENKILDYLHYKESSFFDRLLNKDIYKDAKKNNIPPEQLNHILRVITFYCNNPLRSEINSTLSKYAKFPFLDVPGQGPFVTFALNFQLGFSGNLYPKKFLYKYFKEALNDSFTSYKPKPSEIRSYIKNIDPLVGNLNALAMDSTRHIAGHKFHNEINDVFNNHFIILDLIKDKQIKDLVSGLIYQCKCGLGEFNYDTFMSLYNLEVFFRDLFD